MIGMDKMKDIERYKLRQQLLLDNIPSNESRDIIICEGCGEFVYLQPVTQQGVCGNCGDTYTVEERVKNL